MELMQFVLAIVGSIIATMLVAEIDGNADGFARWLMEKGVKRLPPEEVEVHREEWHAYISQMPTALRKIFAGFGFIITAERVTRTNHERMVRAANFVLATFLVLALVPSFILVALLLAIFSPDAPPIYRKAMRNKEGRIYYRFQFRHHTPAGRAPIGGEKWVLMYVARVYRNVPSLFNVILGDTKLLG